MTNRPTYARSRSRLLPGTLVPVAAAILGGLLLASAFVIALPLSPALANDTMVGSIGGAVYPLANADIRMEAETVQVICYRGFAEYRVDFKFVNEGGPQTVKLGFPFKITESGDWGHGPAAFRAWQDGRPLTVSIGRGVSGDDLLELPEPLPLAYYLHEAEFPRGETMITVGYYALPTVSAGSRFNEATPPEFIAAGITGGWAAGYGYWLHTGAGWRDTIGKSVVRFRFADSFKGWGVDIEADSEGAYPGNTTSPESYVKLDDRTYQWVFEDYEPTEENDILMAFTTPILWAGADQTVPVAYGAFAGVVDVSGDLGSHSVDWPQGYEAVDGSPDSAWGAEAPGAGGWLRVAIYGDQSLREIRILPGRNDTLSSFTDYGRPKTVKVTFSDGTSMVINLKDEPSLQKFAVSNTAEWVRFDVLDIYPGSKSNDTYISEIDFGNSPAPEFDSFANLIAAEAPPTTQATPTTQSSGSGISSSVTQAPASPVTTTGSTTAATASGDEPGRLLWPAFVAAAVAAVALGVLIVLVVTLRRRKRITDA